MKKDQTHGKMGDIVFLMITKIEGPDHLFLQKVENISQEDWKELSNQERFSVAEECKDFFVSAFKEAQTIGEVDALCEAFPSYLFPPGEGSFVEVSNLPVYSYTQKVQEFLSNPSGSVELRLLEQSIESKCNEWRVLQTAEGQEAEYYTPAFYSQEVSTIQSALKRAQESKIVPFVAKETKEAVKGVLAAATN